ncbi:hypothetical protein H4582DRAFT_2055094 [Lactarius indigo]|nr:hypothetical protein H4582DRAFT_2055094 [Lactarius indigo]
MHNVVSDQTRHESTDPNSVTPTSVSPGSAQGTFIDDLTSPGVGQWPKTQAIRKITNVVVYTGDIIDSVRITYDVENGGVITPVTVQHAFVQLSFVVVNTAGTVPTVQVYTASGVYGAPSEKFEVGLAAHGSSLHTRSNRLVWRTLSYRPIGFSNALDKPAATL